jgi:hypothetical protein
MTKLMTVKSACFQLAVAVVFPHAKNLQIDWPVRVMASSLFPLGAK